MQDGIEGRRARQRLVGISPFPFALNRFDPNQTDLGAFEAAANRDNPSADDLRVTPMAMLGTARLALEATPAQIVITRLPFPKPAAAPGNLFSNVFGT